MRVKELVDKLMEFDADAQVFISHEPKLYSSEFKVYMIGTKDQWLNGILIVCE